MENAGAIALANSLQHITSLQKVEIDTDMGWKGMVAWAALLLHNTSIQQLRINMAGIFPSHTQKFMTIVTNTLLLGDEGASELSKLLLDCPNQQLLALEGNGIGKEGAKAIAKVLQLNNSLQYLDLSENRIGDEGMDAIAGALQHNTSLRTLSLDGNRKGNDEVFLLAEALQHNTTLTYRLGEETCSTTQKS